MKSKTIKVLSLITPIFVVATTILSGYVDEWKMDKKIEEKVNEAFAKKNDENGEP